MKYTVKDYLLAKKLFGSGGGKEVKRLPDEYQEVEYLRSTGQYIKTDYIPSANVSYHCDIYYVQMISGDEVVFGNSSYYFQWYVNGNSAYAACQPYAFRNVAVGAIHKDEMAHIYVDNDTIFINSIGSQYTGLRSISNMPIYIFAWNESTATLNICKSARIYSLKFVGSDGVLEAEYVPCYRKLDGEIGMYDTISKTFYTNAGTGTFEKGADVRYIGEPPFIVPEYLGSTFKLGKSKLYG